MPAGGFAPGVVRRRYLVRAAAAASEIPAYNHAQVEAAFKDEAMTRASPQAATAQEAASAAADHARSKFYALAMFPYPSGALHMGHVRVYTISDSVARFHRLTGKEVIHPMGWDAFGLPAENAAIERNIDPADWTIRNIAYMKEQLDALACSFDWEREVTTCSPSYYKWTQWLFLQLHKRGLVYQDKALVNWDPVDQTVLANEQVDAEGRSWRSGALVEKRRLRQWFLRITEYAEELERGLNDVDWPESVKEMQRHWIGRSRGYFFDFCRSNPHTTDTCLRVFTTRPETVFGVEFIAVSPTHPLADRLDTPTRQHLMTAATEGTYAVERLRGITLTHPLTGRSLPVLAASYVADGYGTGAVMGVPAHDERDFKVARNEGLPITHVIEPAFTADGAGESTGSGVDADDRGDIDGVLRCYTGKDGTLVNSGKFSGMSVEEAIPAIIELARSNECGGPMTSYRLRDWLVSRQRYWGTPIPLIHCRACGVVPVPESDLPVLLPQGVEYTSKGRSPLATDHQFVNVMCPSCNGPATRDTDTMDTFVDSAWYFLRYLDPDNEQLPVGKDAAETEMPVDLYIGGIEHAVLHLLYARFVNMAAADIGLTTQREPFAKLLAQGMVHGETHKSAANGKYLKPDEVERRADGTVVEVATQQPVDTTWEKMSKSKYNGVDPTQTIAEHGVDAARLFVLFKARHTRGYGYLRWPGVRRYMRPTVVENPRYDTADGVTAYMVPRNGNQVDIDYDSTYSSDELPRRQGRIESVLRQRWPAVDATAFAEEEVELAVQVQGRKRGVVTVAKRLVEDHDALLSVVLQQPFAHKWIQDRNSIRKVIVPPKGNIVSIVLNKAKNKK
ncbi:leucyl-tRNA synthetase [Salpingoeca rosetta]|uniref:leucine--tRNA ligase n=1 Tax=Salpingoeca rosetta (strain ATCC 50818 / BSB-021) TaxID=946362 RepID=F2U1U7_SALR5|nr:leucyl-tRNA synthetase [Salpingoeca rosetta]EGD81599.1 leucyl-tRNA synthetase [Salpingoeca rosetta]|eukprot:XP_004996803.1 leucyl-tRNA synthetase [Salpingoeca rosetta]